MDLKETQQLIEQLSDTVERLGTSQSITVIFFALLIVGIFAYFGYNFLVARVEKVVYDLEAKTSEFMDLLNEPVA